MQISDDNLIAYLLGDAPAELAEQIEQQLASDPDLVSRLSHFRMVLGHIDSMGTVYEPPADLVDATLARIDEAESRVQPALSGLNASAAKQTSWWDSTVLTLSLTLLCCLVLPAIVKARFESRRVQCANNLRNTGYSLVDFALNNPEQRFPQVDISGRGGFAGVYAVRLKSSGFPIVPAQLQCPSLIGWRTESGSMLLPTIPTLNEIHELALTEFRFLQRVVGGDYAYNLGVIEKQCLVAPRYEGRSHFAILSDSPVFQDGRERLTAHDGRGINILYEDGHTSFVGAPSIIYTGQVSDHPFRNAHGIHAAGLTPQDACLAPSYFSPLGQ